MAKNYELIPGERSNWEVAIFLLIDHLHPGINAGIWFSRTGLTSSIKALDFIEKLLGPIGYEVNKTLENSISSAITRAVQAEYMDCVDSQCKLTQGGFMRLNEIKSKHGVAQKIPIGKTKNIHELAKYINSLPEEEQQEILERLLEKLKPNQ